MESRNPLEALGPRNDFLREEGLFVIHVNKRGEEHKIAIKSIERIEVTPPELWTIGLSHSGTVGITTTQAHKGIWGKIPDLVFFLKNPDELPYAQNIHDYIVEQISR